MTPRRLFDPQRNDPLLSWLIFTGISLFAFILLWYFGFAAQMVTGDRTRISSLIVLFYIGTSAHCLWRILDITREADAAERAAGLVMQGDRTLAAARAGATGLVARHIRDLATKAALQGAQRLDQTLLLRVLADRLRGSNAFGGFAGDTLMKLGLLGTIIGFIMMLAPIAGLDTENRGAIKSSMTLMSDGMAVAMYTTLAGLAGSILVKIQYSFLDAATSRIFAFAVDLTEVHVVSVLERLRPPPNDRGIRASAAGRAVRPVQRRAVQGAAGGGLPVLHRAPGDLAKAGDGKVDSKAEFLITMDWPDNHPDDMDIFVQDPLGNVVWYRRREAGFMVLDRDDRGGLNDFVMVNGEKMQTATRQELVSIRGFVAGEYTVNVYHFTALTDRPVPVTVTVQKLNPIATIVGKETVEVDHGGQEKTRCASPWTLRAP